MSITIKELTFSYRHFRLRVKDLNFESSKITSIVGPNGAGKTTLLKCIATINPVDKGSIFVNGKDISEIKANLKARTIGYVPQEQVSIFNYSVLDFVLMGRTPYISFFSRPSKKDKEIAERALEFVGIPNFSDRHILQLSSGERRLVLLARTIAQDPEILLMDEPTSFLDPKHEIEIMELVKKLSAEKRKTLILTLHHLDLAVKYSDHLIFMKEGKILGSGSKEEILNEELLEKVYDIKMKILEFHGKKIILR